MNVEAVVYFIYIYIYIHMFHPCIRLEGKGRRMIGTIQCRISEAGIRTGYFPNTNLTRNSLSDGER
jgi:hypothetical protein